MGSTTTRSRTSSRAISEAVKAKPLSTGRTTQFWFNWSGARATDFKKLWQEVEDLFVPATPKIKRRSLGKTDTQLTLDLS